MKNEVYLEGIVKRVNVYDAERWQLWLTVPKVGADGTTSVPVASYGLSLPDEVTTNTRVEIVGHLSWRRLSDEQFEMVVVVDGIKPVPAARKGVTNGHNTNARRAR